MPWINTAPFEVTIMTLSSGRLVVLVQPSEQRARPNTANVLETFELYGCYVQNINYNTLAYATSDPVLITLTVKYDNAIQTPRGTGIGTQVSRAIGTAATG